MYAAILPLLLIMVPQIALSALQIGLPVLGPAIVADLGMVPEAVGLIGGCVGIGSLWMFAGNAAITPALGPVRALTVACALSVAGGAMVVSGIVWAVFAGAVMIGFAYAVTAPAGSQILSSHTPRHLWGTVFSIRQAGVPLGGAVAGIVGAGFAAATGWRFGITMLAVLPLAAVGLLLLAPARYRRDGVGGGFRPLRLLNPALLIAPFRTVLERPMLHRLTLASLGFAVVQSSMFAFFTTYLVDGRGFDLATAGSLFAVMQIASFLGRIGIGFAADRLGSIPPILIAMSVTGALSCAAITQMTTAWPPVALVATVAVIGAFTATWNGLFLAEIANRSSADDVSTATAGTTFFTFVAYMITPPAFAGIALLAGYEAAYLACAVAALGSLCVLWRGL